MINFDINPYVEEYDDIDFELEPLNEDIRDQIDGVVQDAQDTWDSFQSGDGDPVASTAKLTRSTRNVVDELNKGLDPITVNNPSIIQRASKSTMQFPVYISENIPITIAQILNSMIERTYATFVTQAFASNKVITADQANNFKFMKGYHSNLREAVEFIDSDEYKHILINEYYEPIDDFDQMMLESLAYDIKLNDRISMSVRAVPYKEPTLCAESKRLAADACEGLKVIVEADTLDGYTKVNSRQSSAKTTHTDLDREELRQMVVDTIDPKKLPSELKNVKQASLYYAVPYPKGDTAAQEEYLDQQLNMMTNPPPDVVKWKAKQRRQWEAISNAVDKYTDRALDELKNGKGPLTGKGLRYNKDSKQFFRTSTSFEDKSQDQFLVRQPDLVRTNVPAPQILKDNEIRKINQMDPWVIQVTFRVKADDGSLDSIIPYLIGVKAVMHRIRATDLNDDLYNIITGTNKSLQKVRYKTGEISFMDYMFNASQLKKDAMTNIDYNKRWVNNLKRLAELANTRGSSFKQIVELLNKGDVPIPNATLVMTSEDVEDLKDTTGIDINKLGVARTLIKNLFLISIIVVNIGHDTLRILYGNQNTDWETQSMSTIKADNARAMNSEAAREIEKAMNKMVNR